MRHIIACAALAAALTGCSEETADTPGVDTPGVDASAEDFDLQPEQPRDLSGEYFYQSVGSTCRSFIIDSLGFVTRGPCGPDSRVECPGTLCSLVCRDYNSSDTTAIFSIVDLRPVTDRVAVGPYDPSGLSATEWWAKSGAARDFLLFPYLVDCEYVIKAVAEMAAEWEASEE